MRADADLMVYVAARWPSLVKDAVLLGVHPDEAADVTAEALARCRRGWGRSSREENVDALVRQELVRAASRRPRTPEASREQAARELLVLAPPDLDDLKHRESESNRAVLKRAGIVAVPLLLVAAGAGAYVATNGSGAPDSSDDELSIVRVTREVNPAPGFVWYADGQLHLDHEVLAVDGLRDMVRIGDGVVYGDDDGRVVYAADDGSRTVLGHKDPAVPVAATDENGWAAWIDTGADRPTVVVKQAETGNEINRFQVDASARVVAVDGSDVYFEDGDGAHKRSAQASNTIALGPGPLVDVRSRVTVFQRAPDTIQVVQSIFNQAFEVPGRGAALAPDGTLVITHDPVTDAVLVYDNRSGERLLTGVADGEQVVAVAAGARDTLALVVRRAGAAPDSDLELRTCDQTGCVVDAHLPGTGDDPVLAR